MQERPNEIHLDEKMRIKGNVGLCRQLMKGKKVGKNNNIYKKNKTIFSKIYITEM